MDENIKASIEARKTAITNTYELKGSAIKQKYDAVFQKMEELGRTSKDVMDFETKLAASPINQEYTELFTEIATQNISLNNVASAAGKSTGEMVAEEVIHQTGSRLKSAVVPTRASVHQAAFDKVRDIPGVGEALEIKQGFDLLSRFKKKD
ncbi:hypothetical protein IJ114_01950 [Candidatus Saccharibacteria bacterium]|nr:hypothetical protein [Candidatus Saccharibacteria bacterium]